jgi:hypothetical protein
MPSKEQILNAVAQALEAMGVGEPDGDEYDESGLMSGNEVPIWSKLSAGTLGQGNGPLHDKSELLGMNRTSKPPTVDNYGMPVDDEAAEMSVAMGIV